MYDVRGVKRVRFADDHGYTLEMKPTPREDWEQIANMSKWPKLADDDNAVCDNRYKYQFALGDNIGKEGDGKAPEEEEEETDANQNFHQLIPSIYNYKLPSALHQPDSFFDLPPSQADDQLLHPGPTQTRFQRPIFPVRLLADMRDATHEIHLMNQIEQPVERTIPEYTSSCFPTYVDQWANSSVLEKHKLSNKSHSQMM